MDLDTKYLFESTTGSEKAHLVGKSLIKSIIFTTIIMCAAFQLFFKYPNIDTDLYPHMIIFCLASSFGFISLMYREFHPTLNELVDESAIDTIIYIIFCGRFC
jgi:hypothetical protein